MTDLPVSLTRVVNETPIPAFPALALHQGAVKRTRESILAALLANETVLAADAALARLAEVERERDAARGRVSELNQLLADDARHIEPLAAMWREHAGLPHGRANRHLILYWAAGRIAELEHAVAPPATGGETAERPNTKE